MHATAVVDGLPPLNLAKVIREKCGKLNYLSYLKRIKLMTSKSLKISESYSDTCVSPQPVARFIQPAVTYLVLYVNTMQR